MRTRNIFKRSILCSNLYHFGVQQFNANKNYYNILNISKDASTDQIKKAYHTLAKKYHPDLNPNKQHQFKQINQAYSILSDQQLKNDYDIASGIKQDPRNTANSRNTHQNTYNQQYQKPQYDDPHGYGYNHTTRDAHHRNPFQNGSWKRFTQRSQRTTYQDQLNSVSRLFKLSIAFSILGFIFLYIVRGRRGRQQQYYVDQYGNMIPQNYPIPQNSINQDYDLVIGQEGEYERKGYRTRQYNQFLNLPQQHPPQQYPHHAPNSYYSGNRHF